MTGAWESCSAAKRACPYGEDLHRIFDEAEYNLFATASHKTPPFDPDNPNTWAVGDITGALADTLTKRLGGPFGKNKVRLLITRATWYGTRLDLKGIFTIPGESEAVGDIRRDIEVGGIVKNNGLNLDRKFRTETFTSELEDTLDDWHRTLGCAQVKLLAKSSIISKDPDEHMVGAYVWAKRNSYQWDGKPAEVIERVEELLDENDFPKQYSPLLRRMLDDFNSENPENWPKPGDIAALDGGDLGKRILLANVSWNGKRSLVFDKTIEEG